MRKALIAILAVINLVTIIVILYNDKTGMALLYLSSLVALSGLEITQTVKGNKK
jgi:hypothetical protein